jgi:hypothetical protein
MTIFDLGKVMLWYRPSADQRSTDAITVKIVRVARNGFIVKMPDGTLKRAARDGLKPPKPGPAKRSCDRRRRPRSLSVCWASRPGGFRPCIRRNGIR